MPFVRINISSWHGENQYSSVLAKRKSSKREMKKISAKAKRRKHGAASSRAQLGSGESMASASENNGIIK